MQNNMDTSFNENVETLFSDLQNITKSETVLGDPLTVGDKTLVPLMSVTLGYGSTGMGAKAQIGCGTNASSGGHGLGAKVTSNAVIVIDNKKDSVNILSTSDSSTMNQIIDKLPQTLSSIGQSMMGNSSQQNGSQNQQNSNQAQQNNQQNSQKNNQ